METLCMATPVFVSQMNLSSPLIQSTPVHPPSSLTSQPTSISSPLLRHRTTGTTSVEPLVSHNSVASLETQLRVLADVNRELKRLLVASVGNDLEQQIEELSKEKVQLAHDLDASVSRITEYHEDLDELVVECDIWRSKFLASRVLIEELSSWRSTLVASYGESQKALEGLLRERDAICHDMVTCQENLRLALQLIGEMDEVKGRERGMELHLGQRRSKVATVVPIQLSELGTVDHNIIP